MRLLGRGVGPTVKECIVKLAAYRHTAQCKATAYAVYNQSAAVSEYVKVLAGHES